MSVWTKEEITNIMLQLEEWGCPFKGYSFVRTREGLSLLGKGAFSYVFEAKKNKENKLIHGTEEGYAISVIGFGSKRLDPVYFKEYVFNQEKLGWTQGNVVSVYNYTQLICRISGDGRVTGVRILDTLDEEGSAGADRKAQNDPVKADRKAQNDPVKADQKAQNDPAKAGNKQVEAEENSLQLQFLLMEKLEPVIRFESGRAPQLYPEELARFEEGEILKLAWDVGAALSGAHESKILHRDVKLENVFYSPALKRYKLGDFGISKITQEGLADTKTFTRGYGAPEVIAGEEYDATVDIYSLGMMIYVLLNRLKFPGSEGYYPNPKVQYIKDAALPGPEMGSREVKDIILRMCAFRPNDRYPSVEAAMQDLEQASASKWTGFQKRHRKSYVAMAVLFLLAGCFLGKLILAPEQVFRVTPVGYVYLALGIFEAVWHGAKLPKDWKWNVFKIMMTVLGVIWCLVSGFALWKLLLVVCGVFFTGYLSAVAAGALLTIKGAELALSLGMISKMSMEQSWLVFFFLSSAFMLFFEAVLLRDVWEGGRTRSPYFNKALNWPFCLNGIFLVIGFVLNGVAYWSDTNVVSFLLRQGIAGELAKWHFAYAGEAGFLFWGLWNLREQIMLRIKGKKI